MNPALVAQTPPVNPDAATLPDIQDIIPPESIPSYWLIIIAIILGLIYLAGMAYLVFTLLRKNKTSAPRISADRIALEKLDELEKQAEQVQANELSLQVSDILKDYLKQRFHDSFRYETSEEFIQRLSTGATKSLPHNLKTNLTKFMGTCDQLKFARPATAETSKLPLIEEARRIIREPISINAAPPVS